MRITRAQWDELVAHAREEAPNECCGYLKARDGRVEEVFRSENTRHSRYGYELDSNSLLAAYRLDEEGFAVGIYHSHPASPAEPSQMDINAANYPEWLYLIISLAGDGEGAGPEVRAWWLADGRVQEEELLVDGDG